MIEEYISLANICANTDFADRKAVAKNNKCADKMRKIAKKIGNERNMDSLQMFRELLDVTENEVNLWGAIHWLELIGVDDFTNEKALNIIKNHIKIKGKDYYGFELWLKEYEESHHF